MFAIRSLGQRLKPHVVPFAKITPFRTLHILQTPGLRYNVLAPLLQAQFASKAANKQQITSAENTTDTLGKSAAPRKRDPKYRRQGSYDEYSAGESPAITKESAPRTAPKQISAFPDTVYA